MERGGERRAGAGGDGAEAAAAASGGAGEVDAAPAAGLVDHRLGHFREAGGRATSADHDLEALVLPR